MSVAERYGIDLSYPHKTACPRCRRNGGDSGVRAVESAELEHLGYSRKGFV